MSIRRSVFAAFLILVGWIWLCGSSGSAEPAIEIDAMVFDFGKIFQGQTVEHTFTFKNTGDQLLEILNVKAECGCTATVLSEEDKSLNPGETGEIRVTFDSRGKKGVTQKGIDVQTNDPKQKRVKLQLVGDIGVHVEILPPRASLGKVARGSSPPPVSVRLSSGDGKPFDIQGVNKDSQRFDATWAKQSDGSFLVTLQMKQPPGPNDALGPMHEEMTCTTAHPDQPMVQLFVDWMVCGSIVLSPFNKVKLIGMSGKGASGSLEVLAMNETPFKVLEVTGVPDFVSAEIREVEPGRKVLVSFTLRENAPVGQTVCQIKVKTDSPTDATLDGELTVLVHPKPGAQPGAE